MFKKFLSLLFIAYFICLPTLALDFDVSVDEEIRKKYDSDKLKYEILPELPKVDVGQSNVSKSETEVKIPQITQIEPSKETKIPAWTHFQVRSNLQISDWQTKGANVSFSSVEPVMKNNINIPKGTKFYGKVVASHQPQMSGNGGLVMLEVNAMTYNGKTYPVTAKITKANSKNIFFNRMKGERKYLDGVASKIDQGEAFYNKSRSKSNKLAANPILVILSPVPTVVGIVGYSVCTVLSPITALTTKGGHLSIPSGSSFEIKLLDPAYVK